MWSVYLDSNPIRTASTRGLGLVSRRAYYGPLAPLRSRQISKAPLPGRQWVRVRNTLAGISGTDIAQVHLRLHSQVSLAALPRRSRLYLGHEVVGEVREIGPDVAFLRVGDRVAYQFDQFCATRGIEPLCRQCAVGNFALCENRYLPGPAAIGGGWSDEMILHERQLYLVPDDLSDEQAVLLDPAAVALHTVLRCPPQPSENVLVIGGGTIGLLTTQVARILAPNASVATVARYPAQVEMATRMGATRILYEDEGMAAVAGHTGGRRYKRRFGPEVLIGGFDVVFDTIGSPETMQNAILWTRGGGVVVQAGTHLAPSSVDLTPIWHQELTIVGSTGHGSETWPSDAGPAPWVGWTGDNGAQATTFALAAALMRDQRLTPQLLITHRFPLQEFRQALSVAKDKRTHNSIKVLLDGHTRGSRTSQPARTGVARTAAARAQVR